jgi:hypothetical protein
MSETTSTIIQGGALAILFAFMAVSIRYLAQELKTVRFQLQALENRLLTGAGLPAVPPPPPPPGQGEPFQ